MPGAEAALRRLAASGITLGLCTNKDSEPALAILRRLHAEGLFRAVVGGDSGLARKPDPAPLTACLSACGARPEDAVYVGDSEIDAQTAGFARLPFLLYTEGYRSTPLATLPHDAAFSHFALLPQVIQALSARSESQARDAGRLGAVIPFPQPAQKVI
jgi:phosphoglycolate phosphatase